MEFFKEHRFNSGSRLLLDRVQAVLDEYAEQGFALTLRQMF